MKITSLYNDEVLKFRWSWFSVFWL